MHLKGGVRSLQGNVRCSQLQRLGAVNINMKVAATPTHQL
jgi:hypothetical protein